MMFLYSSRLKRGIQSARYLYTRQRPKIKKSFVFFLKGGVVEFDICRTCPGHGFDVVIDYSNAGEENSAPQCVFPCPSSFLLQILASTSDRLGPL